MDAVIIKFPSVLRHESTYAEYFTMVQDIVKLFKSVGLKSSIIASSTFNYHVSHTIKVKSPHAAHTTPVGYIEMEYPGKDVLDVLKIMPDVDSAYTYLLSLAVQPKPVA